jgi:hypothetical protein
VVFSLPIGIVFIVKKDYQALKHISIIYLLIAIVSYLGLTISLLILPILVGYRSIIILVAFIKVNLQALRFEELLFFKIILINP